MNQGIDDVPGVSMKSSHQEWFEQYSKLQLQVNQEFSKWKHLLRSHGNFIESNMNNNMNISTSLLYDYKSNEKLLQELKSQLKSKLIQTKKSIIGIQTHLRSKDKLNLQVNEMQTIFEAINVYLTSFKSELQQDISNTNQTIKELSFELESFKSSFDINEDNKTHDLEKKTIRLEQQILQNVEKDISNRSLIGSIDRQLAIIGRSGGWDSRDHDIFLKVWTQVQCDIKTPSNQESSSSKADIVIINELQWSQAEVANSNIFLIRNKKSLLQKLLKLLPGYSIQELEKHIQWFVYFTILQEKKKELLDSWKIQKRREKLHAIELNVNDIEEVTSTPRPNTLEEVKKEEERLANRLRIENWKKQKQEEQEHQKIIEKIAQDNERMRRLEERRALREATQSKLRQWKETEVFAKSKVQEVDKQLHKRAQSADPNEILRRRMRDVEVGKERFQKTQEKSNAAEIRRQHQLETAAAVESTKHVRRDSSRLQMKTKALIGTEITSEMIQDDRAKRLTLSAHEKPIVMTGRDLRQRLVAVPTWRKNL